MNSDGDMAVSADVGGDEREDGDGHANVYWGLDCGVDVGELWEDDVEQEPELEHDVSRSTH